MGSNAKSLIADEGGYIKILSDESGYIRGAQLICADADNLISEISLAIVNHLTLKEFLKVIRPHPSVEEALGGAAESALLR